MELAVHSGAECGRMRTLRMKNGAGGTCSGRENKKVDATKIVASTRFGTLHQKRYFAFLCYRGHFLLHKPGVKMMSRGLFHFSGNLIEYY